MIYVVRHGETDWNKEGRLQGRKGISLNENGVKQAEFLKNRLEKITFNYVFSSPQERAIQTVEIATGIKPVIDNRLNVFDLGEADGLRKGEVKLAGVTPDPTIYNGVEGVESYVERVFHFMKELETKFGEREVNILLSGHQCTTGCIGAYFEGIPADGNILRYSSDNGDYKVYDFHVIAK